MLAAVSAQFGSDRGEIDATIETILKTTSPATRPQKRRNGFQGNTTIGSIIALLK
jgi:hypothetical protein